MFTAPYAIVAVQQEEIFEEIIGPQPKDALLAGTQPRKAVGRGNETPGVLRIYAIGLDPGPSQARMMLLLLSLDQLGS